MLHRDAESILVLSWYQDACTCGYNPRKRMKYSRMDQDSKKRGKFSSSTSLCLLRIYIYNHGMEREFNRRLSNAGMNNSLSLFFFFFRIKTHGAIRSEQTFPLTDAS